ncbi:MAG: GtrA family protein [Coprobacillus sp.]|nr:GtrA family protein [Coprobacillus sp.]
MAEKTEKSKSKFGRELGRFAITGLSCAIIDYLVCELFLFICRNIDTVWANIIATFAGFLVGATLNYVISTFWVYKDNTDKKKKESKTGLFVVKFLLLAFVALLISEGVMVLSQYIVRITSGYDIANFNISGIFTTRFWIDAEFWLYLLCFVIKTVFGAVWNYYTRKYILYKTNTKRVKNPDNSNIENEVQKE